MFWTQPFDEAGATDPSMAVTALRDEHDPSRIVEGLLGGDSPDRPPFGHAIVSEVTRETVGTLTSAASLLRDRRRDARPVLVAVTANRRALAEVSDAYELTLALGPPHEPYLPGVKRFLPTLCTDHQVFGLGARASIRAISVDVGGLHPGSRSDADRVAHRLRADRGAPLHPLAEEREPDAFVFAAPGGWHDTVREGLSDLGPVLGSQGSPTGQIAVAGLVFDSAATQRAVTEAAPADGDDDAEGGLGPDRVVGSAARFPDETAREEAIDGLGETATNEADD